MTIHENARFTVFRLVDEYNPQSGDLWKVAKAIRTAYEIGAITMTEAEALGREVSALTLSEIMTA